MRLALPDWAMVQSLNIPRKARNDTVRDVKIEKPQGEGTIMSIERPWLASYPKNVPAQIDLDEFGSIPDILAVACKDFAAHPAFENMGRTLSYAQVDALSQQFGAYLLHELKLKKGDRVAIMLPNVLQYPIA